MIEWERSEYGEHVAMCPHRDAITGDLLYAAYITIKSIPKPPN